MNSSSVDKELENMITTLKKYYFEDFYLGKLKPLLE
jgi:hypothetical protein